MSTPPFHLAIALDGTGWHPASWREPGARPGDQFGPEFWVDQARAAEAGFASFVTIEDGFTAVRKPSDEGRTDRSEGHLDATLIAQRVGPVTEHLGIVPTVITTHTEPFHVSTQIATLDWVTSGRAGQRIKVSADPAEAALFGRRDPKAETRESLFDETADHVEVQRGLWDSWEDDAEIRDVATGRFIDREKLHYIDFVGSHFAVRGPSITPRPPQGQPVVTALAHVDTAYRLAARAADVVFTTPDGAGRDGPTGDAATTLAATRAAEAEVGRTGDPLLVVGDLLVVLDDDAASARAHLSRLDAVAPLRSDAAILAGTVGQVADTLESWAAAGLSGARLRPAVTASDLPRITRELAPELARRGLTRSAWGEPGTFRDLLGLPRPADRYAHA
ncbi:LLM class flavin-dependent oxidoreductase [Actinomycetospora endophytica]|uniref:LLM class flavin-dependent oxidoreductase n=1 Tax=Actinomycetospora endophytica TaxID=2291215 RepID=A0ABS8PJ31_9PSEU|nr:LLM class flavin-dependent oxidoreductase [Actinomycetospora endophytica]MCD2197932.1 LLM class flavin-dependent oxidoreductase [Actinomycetospora endophytica]